MAYSQDSTWQALRHSATLWTLDSGRIDPIALERKCLGWISAAERARYDAISDSMHRHEFLSSHAMCRAALAQVTGMAPWQLRFSPGRCGKPRLVGPAEFRSLRFNLTHTRDLSALLVSRAGLVGVDAEWIGRPVDIAQVARHFFSTSMQAMLSALSVSDRQRAFYEQWVLREAMVKGRGIGLAAPLDGEIIAVDPARHTARVGRWRLSLSEPVPSTLLATAIARRGGVETPIHREDAGELFESITPAS